MLEPAEGPIGQLAQFWVSASFSFLDVNDGATHKASTWYIAGQQIGAADRIRVLAYLSAPITHTAAKKTTHVAEDIMMTKTLKPVAHETIKGSFLGK